MKHAPLVSLLPLKPDEMSVAEFACWLLAAQLYEREMFTEEAGPQSLPGKMIGWAQNAQIERVSPATIRKLRQDPGRAFNRPTYERIVKAYEDETHDYAERDQGLWIAIVDLAIERGDLRLLRAGLRAGVVEMSGHSDSVGVAITYDFDDETMDAIYERRRWIRREMRSISLQRPITSDGQVRVIEHRRRCDQRSRSQPLVRSL